MTTNGAFVPRFPTEAMLDAARDWSIAKHGQEIRNADARGCWGAMFEAGALSTPEAEAPWSETFPRNLGWFSGLARKHGYHVQADALRPASLRVAGLLHVAQLQRLRLPLPRPRHRGSVVSGGHYQRQMIAALKALARVQETFPRRKLLEDVVKELSRPAPDVAALVEALEPFAALADAEMMKGEGYHGEGGVIISLRQAGVANNWLQVRATAIRRAAAALAAYGD